MVTPDFCGDPPHSTGGPVTERNKEKFAEALGKVLHPSEILSKSYYLLFFEYV